MKQKTTTQLPPTSLTCGICGTTDGQLSKYLGGYVCDDCSEANRIGHSTTTKALRSQQRANRAALDLVSNEEVQAPALAQLEYVKAAGELLAADSLNTPVDCIQLAGGEVAAASDVQSSKFTTDIVSLEASNERVRLLSMLGHDIAALALDTANAVGAVGGVEQMVAHQLATAYHQAMTLMNKSAVEPDPAMGLQYSRLAVKWMSATSEAALTLKKLKTGGEQRYIIEHLNVSNGGQAVIGDVQAGGGQCKS